MNNYGKVAIRAVQLIHEEKVLYTSDAWTNAAIEVFTDKTTRHKKACPRSTFLGLCEAGFIHGVNSNNIKESLRKDTNKQYALCALRLLQSDSSLVKQPRELWKIIWTDILMKKPISHNFQMDVLTALWEEDLIIKNKEVLSQAEAILV